MVAGLFAKHGVWTGTLDDAETQWNPRGSFENLPIKDLIRRHYGKLPSLLDGDYELLDPTLRFEEELVDTVLADGYEGGRWLIKVSVLACPLFACLKPVYICVRRDPLSIIRSYRRTVARSLPGLGEIVGTRERLLDSMERSGALRIDSRKLINRDYGQITDVFETLGMDFDHQIADAWIDYDLWHF